MSETESQAENGVVLLFNLKMALHASSSKNTRLLDTIHKAVHKHLSLLIPSSKKDYYEILFFFITAYMHTNASPNKQQQTDFLHKNKTIQAEIVTTLNNIESFGK